MEDFIGTVEDGSTKDTLYKSIAGKGVFRRFKEKIGDFSMETRSFAYKHER
ncbi:MAG: hypothetical protein ACI35P_00830 [Bacillus sp. (in: firmicutes)]